MALSTLIPATLTLPDIIAIICVIPFALVVLIYIIVIIAILKKEMAMRKVLDREGFVRSSRGGNYFGCTDKEYAQIRGNGVLILTEEGLHFELLIPKKRIDIPLSSVMGLETTKSFLGKSRGKELLQVNHVMNGKMASSAWQLKDLDEWVKDINSRIGKV